MYWLISFAYRQLDIYCITKGKWLYRTKGKAFVLDAEGCSPILDATRLSTRWAAMEMRHGIEREGTIKGLLTRLTAENDQRMAEPVER
jgi:hypothetical protein